MFCPMPNTPTTVTCYPGTLSPSACHNLWKSLPEKRRADGDGHVALYDDVHQVQNHNSQKHSLRVVVSSHRPKDLPNGVFWIPPTEEKEFLAMIRLLGV